MNFLLNYVGTDFWLFDLLEKFLDIVQTWIK